MPTAKITAIGCFVPPRVLSNYDLSQMVETTDEWITERTGIRERHIADPDIATSDMAVAAAREALDQRGITAAELDVIIVCTVTPDMLFPSTACLVQDRLGASKAWGFDLVAACSGFIYGLTTAAHLISNGTHRKILVIGADTMSRFWITLTAAPAFCLVMLAARFSVSPERIQKASSATFMRLMARVANS